MRQVSDSMGEMDIPEDALYGAQTQRAVDNFTISGRRMPAAFLRNLARIKAAAARANHRCDALDALRAEAIEKAALSVAAGGHLEQFPVPVLQTGSGTSSNMNMNEVLAHLAAAASPLDVHPNDHVNCSQSSNDVIPTCIQMSALLRLREDVLPALGSLVECIGSRGDDLSAVVKTGRTHLMDAMPLTLGQELHAWAAQLAECSDRLRECLPRLQQLPIGGSAVGDFPMAPSLDTRREPLVGIRARPFREETTAPVAHFDFHEIYRGRLDVGGITTPYSEWELDVQSSASLLSGQLRLDALARDLLDNEAVNFPFDVGVGYSETLTFSGTPNQNGEYEILFRTMLDPFTAENERLEAIPTQRWEASASTILRLTPDDSNYDTQIVNTVGGNLFAQCPTFNNPSDPFCAPPFWVTGFEAEGIVTLPASNPVLHLDHTLLAEVTSASIDASNTAGIEVEILTPGVSYISASQAFLVPEPGTFTLVATGLLGLGGWAGRRRFLA